MKTKIQTLNEEIAFLEAELGYPDLTESEKKVILMRIKEATDRINTLMKE